MVATTRWKTPFFLGVFLSSAFLSACSETSHSLSASSFTQSLSPSSLSQSASDLAEALTPSFVKSSGYSTRDKECLARAMFFESRRSSREGMIAVGTVVMNRKRSGQYPDTICEIVGQEKQFAPGVLTRPMDTKALPDVMEAAEAVLEGERHPKLRNAMHFHTAGLKFRYNNMHYVAVAGGNSFYEKRGRRWQPLPPEDGTTVMVASAPEIEPAAVDRTVLVASAEPRRISAQTTAFAALPDEAPTFVPQKRQAAAVASAAHIPAAVRPAPRQEAVALAEPSADRFGGSGQEEASLSYGDAPAGAILILPAGDPRFGN